jgi:electron transfer flavoprotein beta subunit
MPPQVTPEVRVSYRIVVLAKQVPDTHNITGQAMKEDGTVNRQALPAVFNPEDLNALEEALKIKERHGGTVSVVTMGPPNASQILKDSLFRGADKVVLVSDRVFAGADTLATSYALSMAIRKLGDYDLVICGRQAIDGDTAQVGPQTAEKLGIDQITCVRRIVELSGDAISAERSIEGGYELVKAKLPLLLTVTAEANEPRPPSAKRTLAYKHAMTPGELENLDESYICAYDLCEDHAVIEQWSAADIGANPAQCGLAGSPTKVKEIESVVLGAREAKSVAPTKEGLEAFVAELVAEHIIG